MVERSAVLAGQRPVPIPGRLPMVGHILKLVRRPLEFLQQAQARGGIVTIRLGPAKSYFVADPDLLHAILIRNPKDYDKGVHMEKSAQVIGNSLPVSAGAFHRHQRKLILPAFSQARLREYFDIMLECTLANVDTWTPDTDAHREIWRLVGTITVRALFSDPAAGQTADEIGPLLDVAASLMTRRILDPTGLVEKLPLPSNRRFGAARDRLRSITEGLVNDYRTTGLDRRDLLSALLTARDEGSGAGMSDRQLRDEATGFLLAGAETTTQSLRWTARALSEHQDVQRRLHEEVDEVLAGHPVTFDDLEKLPYTRQVIAESLRLWPPLYVMSRRPTVDVEVGDYLLPAGSMVLFSPYALHRDPKLYPDPDRFDPDRWRPGGPARALPPASYLPFGAGLRSCIGERFAMIEMLTVLSTIAQRWTLRANPSVTVRPKVAAFILTPNANGVRLEPR